MGNPQVKINDTPLDNGSWRHIVGNPAVLTDPSGIARQFHVEFLIEGDDADERASRFESTFEDLFLLNSRLRVWFDDSRVLPTIDWYPGDGKTTECVSSVSMMPEESQTQGKLHCLFSFIASTQIDFSEIVPSSDGINSEDMEGLASALELSKIFMDSEKYSLAVKGSFKSTQNVAAEGPYNILSISDNGGKVRLTLKNPHVIVAAFADGMFVDVDSTSAYEGRHFVSALSGGNTIIDTTTEFVAPEADIGATLLLGTTTTAEDNFKAAKSNIFTSLLETDTDGRPSPTWPHMGRWSETLVFTSSRKDELEFVLVSGPSSMDASLNNSSGNDVARGLTYSVQYVPSERQDTSVHGILWDVVVNGKVAIADTANEKDLAAWFDELKLKVQAEVESVANARIGGRLRERTTTRTFDYTTGDVTFTMVFYGNYSGTIAYSRSEAYSTSQPRTIWRDADGNNPTQSPKGPPHRSAVITIDWTGDEGGAPQPPPPPSESGFQYLYDSDTLVKVPVAVDINGNRYQTMRVEFRYTRIKPVGGSGGGGRFNSSGYFVPTSPDI